MPSKNLPAFIANLVSSRFSLYKGFTEWWGVVITDLAPKGFFEEDAQMCNILRFSRFDFGYTHVIFA